MANQDLRPALFSHNFPVEEIYPFFAVLDFQFPVLGFSDFPDIPGYPKLLFVVLHLRINFSFFSRLRLAHPCIRPILIKWVILLFSKKIIGSSQ